MAALNKVETEALGEAMQIIKQVLAHGYDPEKANSRSHIEQHRRKLQLEKAVTALHTIRVMKGYYSK